MPELPEVENVRLGLASAVIGKAVTRVSVRRAEVVRGPRRSANLLRGRVIDRIDRLGKQLALVGRPAGKGPMPESAGCVCIHLGMTGSLRHYPAGTRRKPALHTHVIWHLNDGSQLAFRDPRRFGGVWTFDSMARLNEDRWSRLGEDALTITPRKLDNGLSTTKRALKAALLDQAVVAGLGNIYVDELLFGCGLSPLRPGYTVSPAESRLLVRRMRVLLKKAIDRGGSTLRDYVDASGNAGGFQQQHKAYGRSGLPCLSCGQALASETIAGRTTVYCPVCQR